MLKISFNSINKIFRTTTPKTPKIGQSLGVDTVSLSATDLLDCYIDKMQEISPCNIVEKLRFRKFIKKIIPQIVTPENFINEGKDSKVYWINNKYVARVAKRCKPENLIRFFHMTSRPNTLYKDIEIYYGQPVIKIGRFEILKNATPTKDSIVCGLGFNKKEFPPEEIKEYEKRFLKYCSSLPQESYDNFALGLRKLNDLSFETGKVYNPDVFNPNNFIISDGQFKIVDEMEVSYIEFFNSLYSMLVPLLLKDSAYVTATVNPEVTAFRRIIYSKCVEAARKAGLEDMDAVLLKNHYDEILKSILEVEELPKQ